MWNREHHRWYSPSLGRDMELLLFGHAGARCVVFPTSQGRFFEWEDQGMIQALGTHLQEGWLQIVCVDSVDAESWYARWKHPADRARRQSDYERYVLDEVLPFSANRSASPFVITTGASFGAYHAVDMAFRHPDRFGRVIGLSGLYDIKEMTSGYSDGEVRAHDPSQYVSQISDSHWVDAMRRLDIILATGRGDSFVGNNEYLSRALWARGIGNGLRLWDGWAHDWPWWREMIVKYIGGHD